MSDQDELDLGALLGELDDMPDDDTEDDGAPLPFASAEPDDHDFDESPIVRLVDQLLRRSMEVPGFSAIHLEPQASEDVRVRLRVDGTLRSGPIDSIPKRLARGVAARLKILSEMDIAERRVPQVGRIRLSGSEQSLSLDMITTPTAFGERIILRHRTRPEDVLYLGDVGFEPEDLHAFRHALSLPAGVILLTGPSSAGLPQLISSCLRELATPERAVLSIGYSAAAVLDGVSYPNVNNAIGVTPARALRNALRSDVDVVAVHDVHGLESLELCFDLALNGTLVLMTLSTMSAPSGVVRMHDMGIEPWLVADMLTCSVGVRRLRRLCACKKSAPRPDAKTGLPEGVTIEGWTTVCEPIGCAECGQSGYSGRTSIFQVLTLEEGARRSVLRREGEKALKAHVRTLREAALRRVAAGETSLSEAIRATRGWSGPC